MLLIFYFILIIFLVRVIYVRGRLKYLFWGYMDGIVNVRYKGIDIPMRRAEVPSFKFGSGRFKRDIYLNYTREVKKGRVLEYYDESGVKNIKKGRAYGKGKV